MAELLPEFIDAALCVNHFLFACVKGVGSRGYLQFNHGIFLAVFPLDYLVCFDCGSGFEFVVAGDIYKNDLPIVWMYAFFHPQNSLRYISLFWIKLSMVMC